MEDSSTAYIVKSSPELGRYIVAATDLEAGTIVIQDWPLIIAPSGKFDVNPATGRHLFVCINCCKTQKEGEAFEKCLGCLWPLCSAKCVESVKIHSKEECSLFHSQGLAQTPRSLQKVYLIRSALLKFHSPAKWDQFCRLACESLPSAEDWANPHGGHRNDLEPNDRSPLHIPCDESTRTDYIYLEEVCKLDHVSPSDVYRINGVMKVNGFGLTNPCSETDKYYGMAIYPRASMASHGCSPNLSTELVYDPGRNFSIIFKTKLDVQQDQVLQIAYREKWLELGTLRRREKLFQDHRFWCQCARCKDGREFGTDFSSVKCELCCHGYLLPRDPGSINSVWDCTDLRCGNVKEETEISELLDRITELTEVIIEGDLPDEKKFHSLDSLLNQGGLNNLLHPNHYLVMRTEVEWMRHFPFHQLEEFLIKPDEKEEKERLAFQKMMEDLIRIKRHCQAVYDQLIPRWSYRNDVFYSTTVKAMRLISKFDGCSAFLKSEILDME